MPAPAPLTFASLSALPSFAHAFTLRHPDIDVAVDRDEALKRLWQWHTEVALELGFARTCLATAQQVHGNAISLITTPDETPIQAVDGLICNTPGVMLGIYVADCCAVYLADPVTGAFGIVHSGKKGTELDITGMAIEAMQRSFGSRPEDLVVQLSPCIRPPAYEVDFAAAIREEAKARGVLPENIHDEGVCTSSDLTRFYSYRIEQGRTGRMLALLGARGASQA